ncbi:MAG: YebC/PmpR family DNA-binding transcriptional regulator [Patescibacteria group bacterium]|nr:YebC/PmpR family DNA-binding transcriptional regulator [Patescibacteria group bacterium]
MSGHSKWSKVKQFKGAIDAKRSANFTKLAREIEIAVREKGPDPGMNFRLRMAIDRARSGNMPKDSIERAITRGSGSDDGVQVESLRYEAYGPGGSGLIIECLTDSHNRTANDVKHILSKNGGTLAALGSVAFQFDHKGVVRAATISKDKRDEVELALIDAGAEDIRDEEGEMTIISAPADLSKVSEAASKTGLTVSSAEFEWLPKIMVSLDPAAGEAIAKLIEILEENDDVQNVFTNAN